MERVDADDNPLSSSSRNNLALRAASRSDNDREHRHRPQQSRSVAIDVEAFGGAARQKTC